MTDLTTERAGLDRARLTYVPVQHSALKNAEIVPMSLRSVHFVLPGGVDDPAMPSGGNAYDRRVSLDLPGFGWQVHKHAVTGEWPRPGAAARDELGRTLAELPDGTVVLMDGLVACGVPEIVVPDVYKRQATRRGSRPRSPRSWTRGSARCCGRCPP